MVMKKDSGLVIGKEELIKSILDLEDCGSPAEKARKLGIAKEVAEEWLSDSGFIKLVRGGLPKATDLLVVEAYAKLAEGIKKGNVKSIDLLLQLKGEKKAGDGERAIKPAMVYSDTDLLARAEELGVTLPEAVIQGLKKSV